VSRRSLSVSALVVSAALLAGCGTGLHSRTYRETGREDGATADLGGRTGVAIRGLHVSAPASGSAHQAGSTAFVTGGLINNGTSNDALVGASSDAAGAVVLLVDGTPTTQVAIPSLGTAPATWSLALTDLAGSLHAATYVPVTLEFQRAGRVTLQVPVYAGDNGLEDREAEQEPYEVE
jgi:copper(I)-binding protein